MKNKLKGIKKTFAFAYMQSMKSKAMKAVLIIFCTLSLISMPLATIIGGSAGSKGDKENNIKTVYVDDLTELVFLQLESGYITDSTFENVKYVESSKEEMEKLLKDDEHSVFVIIEYCGEQESLSYGINTYAYYNEDSKIKKEEAQELAAFIDKNIKKAILKSAGVDEEVIKNNLKETEYSVTLYNEKGEEVEGNNGISEAQYYFTLTVICLLIFVISFMGSKVSELIVTEKSTRVIEYMLTSVKPMAILIGKVMASTMIMITMIVCVVISLIISVVVNNAFILESDSLFEAPDMVKKLVQSGIIESVGPAEIIISLIILILGCVFYGFIAGLAGATVSKIEEMAEGMKIFTFTVMIGAYSSLALSIIQMTGEGADMLMKIVLLCPLSSLFIVPQHLFMGNVSLVIGGAAIGIQIVFIILVVLFVNRVYEHMLYSNGDVLKLKDIIGFAKMKGSSKNGK